MDLNNYFNKLKLEYGTDFNAVRKIRQVQVDFKQASISYIRLFFTYIIEYIVFFLIFALMAWGGAFDLYQHNIRHLKEALTHDIQYVQLSDKEIKINEFWDFLKKHNMDKAIHPYLHKKYYYRNGTALNKRGIVYYDTNINAEKYKGKRIWQIEEWKEAHKHNVFVETILDSIYFFGFPFIILFLHFTLRVLPKKRKLKKLGTIGFLQERAIKKGLPKELFNENNIK